MLKNESPRLSVACLVRDASDALCETLQSVAQIADEIVVGDTGSSDDTRDVAVRMGARVVGIKWQANFAAARNLLMQEVRGQWVLWLDAGETLTPEAAAQLSTFVATNATTDKAYMLLVKRPAGQEVEGEQVGRIRLLPAQQGIRFSGRVRETVDASLAGLGIECEGLPYRIHRTLAGQQQDIRNRRAARNLQLAQLEMDESEVSPRLLLVQAEAFETLGHVQQARKLYRQAMSLSEQGGAERLEAYYGLLTSMDGDSQESDNQLRVCLAGLQEFPLDAQLLCAMGSYLQARGRLDFAARSYETAYRHGQVIPVIWHVDQIREIAAVCFALTLQLQQRESEAIEILNEAATHNPHSTRLHRQLLEMEVKQGRMDQALEQVDALQRIDEAGARRGDWPVFREAVTGACLASQGQAIDARAHLESAYDAGCLDPLCLRWLLLARLSTGERDNAREVLRSWQTAHPHSPELSHFAALFAPANSAGAKRRDRSDAERIIRIDAGGSAASGSTAAPGVTSTQTPARQRRSG